MLIGSTTTNDFMRGFYSVFNMIKWDVLGEWFAVLLIFLVFFGILSGILYLIHSSLNYINKE
jgi:hypothetical protein